MLEVLSVILGGLVAVLLALLGIDRAKLKRKDSQISSLQGQVDHAEKQGDIHQVAQETTQQLVQETQPVVQEQQAQEQIIQEAESEEEIIAAGNDLIDSWNSRIVPDSPEDD